MSGSCRQALPDVRECSGGPPGHPEVVGMPYWMSGSGRLAIPDDLEWSGDPPGSPGVVGSPSWMSRSGREALLNVRKARLDVREWLRVLP